MTINAHECTWIYSARSGQCLVAHFSEENLTVSTKLSRKGLSFDAQNIARPGGVEAIYTENLKHRN